MSAKNFLVVVFPFPEAEPYVVRPKTGETRFSKKEAQREATAHVKEIGAPASALVVEPVLTVTN